MLINTNPGESREIISELPAIKKEPEIISFDRLQEKIENQFNSFKETGINLNLSDQELSFLMKENMKYYNEFRARHTTGCNKFLYQAISDFHNRIETENEKIRKEEEEKEKLIANTVSIFSTEKEIVYVIDRDKNNYSPTEKEILSFCEAAEITMDLFINASVRYFIYACMKNHISIEKNIFENIEIEGGRIA